MGKTKLRPSPYTRNRESQRYYRYEEKDRCTQSAPPGVGVAEQNKRYTAPDTSQPTQEQPEDDGARVLFLIGIPWHGVQLQDISGVTAPTAQVHFFD